MQLWLVLMLSGGALVGLTLLASIEFELEGRALGEPDGSWALAFGALLAGVLISGTLARGVPLALHAHVFGRRWPIRRGKKEAGARVEPAQSQLPNASTAGRARGRFSLLRWLTPSDLVELAVHETRRIAVERLALECAYGFRDIALTGRIAGALYALSGLLPPSISLRHAPAWDGQERWEGSLQGRVAIWPGRVLLDIVWYILRRRSRSKKSARSAHTLTTEGATES